MTEIELLLIKSDLKSMLDAEVRSCENSTSGEGSDFDSGFIAGIRQVKDNLVDKWAESLYSIDGFIKEKYKNQIFAAEIIDDSDNEVTYGSGSFVFETHKVPSIKMGSNPASRIIERINRLKEITAESRPPVADSLCPSGATLVSGIPLAHSDLLKWASGER